MPQNDTRMSANLFQQLNDFFDDYSNALAQMNMKRMVYLHNIPCSFISDDMVTVFTDASKLEGLFNQGAIFYKQFGLTHAQPQLYNKLFLTERLALVKVVWQYFNARGQLIYDCDYHYTLRKDKEELWKIAITTAINEKERMEEWMNKQPASMSLAKS